MQTIQLQVKDGYTQNILEMFNKKLSNREEIKY